MPDASNWVAYAGVKSFLAADNDTAAGSTPGGELRSWYLVAFRIALCEQASPTNQAILGVTFA